MVIALPGVVYGKNPNHTSGVSDTVRNTLNVPVLTTAPAATGVKLSAKNEAKNALIDKISEKLDLNGNYIKPSIVTENGKEFLVLTRDADDKTRPNDRYDFCNGAIKSKLGIRKGVLADNNDLCDVTKRGEHSAYYDNATMEKGKSLRIPLSELGQARYGSNLWRKGDLAEYVTKYQSTK